MAELPVRTDPVREVAIATRETNARAESAHRVHVYECDSGKPVAALDPQVGGASFCTPLFSLDRIYTRGFDCRLSFVPRGKAWARMSDHLPLVAELQPV